MNTDTKSTTVRARMNPQIKSQAEQVFKSIGISPSEAINVFYTRVASEQGIPFSLHIPNQETNKAIKNAMNGKNITEYSNARALLDSI